MKYGATPFLITGGDLPVGLPYSPIIPFLSLFTSIFIHGGYYHLASNMLFLYVFADNVESILGHKKFLIYYLHERAWAQMPLGTVRTWAGAEKS